MRRNVTTGSSPFEQGEGVMRARPQCVRVTGDVSMGEGGRYLKEVGEIVTAVWNREVVRIMGEGREWECGVRDVKDFGVCNGGGGIGVSVGGEGVGFWRISHFDNKGKRWKGRKRVENIGTLGIEEFEGLRGGRVGGDGESAEVWGEGGVMRITWRIENGEVKGVRKEIVTKRKVEGECEGWVDRGGYWEDRVTGDTKVYNLQGTLDLQALSRRGNVAVAASTEVGVGVVDEEVSMDEERSDELRTLVLGTKAIRARTSVQDAPTT